MCHCQGKTKERKQGRVDQEGGASERNMAAQHRDHQATKEERPNNNAPELAHPCQRIHWDKVLGLLPAKEQHRRTNV